MTKYTFFDCFSGIGGMRAGFARAGFVCKGACEIDKFARQTYSYHFPQTPNFMHDVRELSPIDLPDCHVFAAGITLDLDWSKVLSKFLSFKRTPLILLETPAPSSNLLLQQILDNFRDVGYHILIHEYADYLVVPQKRERLYIVGIHEYANGSGTFRFPTIRTQHPSLFKILSDDVDSKYFLSEERWLDLYKQPTRFKIPDLLGYSAPLPVSYHKNSRSILVLQDGVSTPRRLTPQECCRLAGMPKSYETLVVSETQAYRQFAQASIPYIIQQIAGAMIDYHLR